MTWSQLVMMGGFILSAYAVVGNDVIQTLGTFLSSNRQRPWYILWLFAGGIMTITLIYGWANYGGDVSYGRLERIQQPETYQWPYLLPPLALMLLTRLGIPASTTFMILSFFAAGKTLESMINKSLVGYGVALLAAGAGYFLLVRKAEKYFVENPMLDRQRTLWTVFQWSATTFLWSQWLIQDLANIYIYLPAKLSAGVLSSSLAVLLAMLGYIFYSKGGKIQQIVESKINTADIRSATLIDVLFGIILYLFKEQSKIPMSTSWVFVGLLAGRELALRYAFDQRFGPQTLRMVAFDLGKIMLGLVVSIGLVFIIRWLTVG